MYYHPHPDSGTTFMLGRHGESVRNKGIVSQGRGEEIEGLPPNRLTDEGVEQVKAMPAVLAAAGISSIQYVNSSGLLRAQESAEVFVDAHPHPKPILAENPIPNLEEVSKKGWENVHTRNEAKGLQKTTLAKEVIRLCDAGLRPELRRYVGWISLFGEGESPLEAALRGIDALETHGVKTSELIFSHAMLNRYMDAIATHVPRVKRERLKQLLRNSLAVGKIATLQAIVELGIPAFEAADAQRNQQPNGGVTIYTINRATGVWIAGRRIEPPKPTDAYPFIEHRRSGDGMWTRLTPISVASLIQGRQ